jgi:hypothetical protein
MTGGQGHNDEVEEGDEEEADQKVVQRVNTSNRIQPRDIMREGLDTMAQRMREQPDESLEELKVKSFLLQLFGSCAAVLSRFSGLFVKQLESLS